MAAILLLMFGSGLWWAMRPQFDPKLIGTWMGVEGSRGFFGLRFKTDGSQQECELVTEGRPVWTSVWRWSLSGNFFHQRANSRRTDMPGRMRAILNDLWDRLRGAPWHYEIIELTDSTLKLRPLNPAWSNYGQTESYTRVPDDAPEIWKKRFAWFGNESPEDDGASLQAHGSRH